MLKSLAYLVDSAGSSGEEHCNEEKHCEHVDISEIERGVSMTAKLTLLISRIKRGMLGQAFCHKDPNDWQNDHY